MNSSFADDLRRYARHENVGFCDDFKHLRDFVPHPTRHWLKMLAILEALGRCSKVLWIDGDVVVTNDWVSLAPVWKALEGADIAFEKSHKWNSVNNGIFAVRNTTLARSFLDVTYKDTAHAYPFYDNSAFLHHLKHHPLKQSRFEGFNTLVLPWTPGMPFLHMAGHGSRKNEWGLSWRKDCAHVAYSTEECLERLRKFSVFPRSTTYRCMKPGSRQPRLAVATLYHGRYLSDRDTFNNHAAYAFANRYAFCWQFKAHKRLLRKPDHWDKLLFLQKLLNSFSLAMWVDADTVFTKMTPLDSVIQSLDATRFVALPSTAPSCRDSTLASRLGVTERPPNIHAREPTNTGCFIVNRHAQEWLGRMFAAPATSSPQQEQLAINEWAKLPESQRHIAWTHGLQSFPWAYAGEVVVHPAGHTSRKAVVSALLQATREETVSKVVCSIKFPCLPFCGGRGDQIALGRNPSSA